MNFFGLKTRAARQVKRAPVVATVTGPNIVGPVSILGGYLRYGSTDRNWRADAGQLESNSTVGTALGKISDKVSQPSLEVRTVNADGSVVYAPDRRLFAIQRPAPGLDEVTVIKSVACALKVYGNAYLIKRRAKSGLVLGYVPLMPWQVFPKSDVHVDGTPNQGDELITRYQIKSYGGGQLFYEAPSEIVHFRNGMVDPINPALGMSPLMACLRQVVSDNEAANYLAVLLTNMGIPGILVSPKDPGAKGPMSEQRASIRERWQSFTRDRRGALMDLPGAFEVHDVAMSPTDLKAIESKVHMMTELLAALGVDPMILGLPSDSKTYANIAEARRIFIEDTVLPLLGVIAKTLDVACVEDGLVLADNQSLAFNPAVFVELSEDVNESNDRAEKSFRAGALTRGEYRRAIGMKTELDDTRLFFDLQPTLGSAPASKRFTPRQYATLEALQLSDGSPAL